MRHQELQMMAVRIAEVDAVRVVFSAVDFDASVFERCFDFVIIARRQAQRHVVHFTAAVNVLAIFYLEESDALAATVEKALPRAFVIDRHAKKIDIELLSTVEVFDMKNDMIDTGDFER